MIKRLPSSFETFVESPNVSYEATDTTFEKSCNHSLQKDRCKKQFGSGRQASKDAFAETYKAQKSKNKVKAS
jgi:hypothetical protein